MTPILQSGAFVLIIIMGFLLRRFGVFGANDYRILQSVVFNLTLPSAIIVSFVSGHHGLNLLLVTLFGLGCALLPIPILFFMSRKRKVSERAFLLLNASGFNVGTFCFPILQAFLGPSTLMVAAMFDMGNAVMVTAGTNVMTTSLLNIDMQRPLHEQYKGDAPVVPAGTMLDKDARRLQRRSRVRNIIKGFVTSPSFDIYMVMIVVTIFSIKLPEWIGTVLQPISMANPFCSMLMVGMLMDLPHNWKDIKAVLEVIGWRLPLAAAFALFAWFILPFDGVFRKALVMVCFAPTAVFATLFTDKVLGNPKLAGFTLAATAFIAIVIMTVLNVMLPV
ncbi:MAG: permease [Bifidobacteriaceae bacterium]|jgi:predicted permease|nr:permease [Bifidobacteriaceae bacterium]